MPEDIREPGDEGPAAEGGPADLGDSVAERVAAARRAVEDGLRAVLADLEREQAALRRELAEPLEAPADERIEAAASRAAEAAVARLARRLDETLEHTDRALALIGESERRMLELSRRVAAAGWRIADALAIAGRAADGTERLDAAARAEEEAARRIAAAERRLADTLADGPR